MEVISSGTQAATINTEHILDTDTPAEAKVYVLQVDTSNMALGDVLELRVKGKTLSGGDKEVYDKAVFSNVQAKPLKQSIPFATDVEVEVTLKQTVGTGRDFPWKLFAQ